MIIVDQDGKRWRPEDYVEELEGRVFDGTLVPQVAMMSLRSRLGGAFPAGSEAAMDQMDRFLNCAVAGEEARSK